MAIQNSIGAPVSAFGKTLIDDTTQAEAVSTLLDNASLTSTTIATDDLVIIQDSSNGKAARTVTTQQIADLAGTGAAPADATYITQVPSGSLSNEQALSLLSTGIMKSDNGTGVVSIASQGVDYYAPGGTDVAIADGGTGASTNTDAINNLVSGATLTTTTIASDDLVMVQDSSDSFNLKSVTAQDIANLGPGGSAAPGDATFITQTPNGTLTNEQALSLLATGIMKNTSTTGVISIATPNVDYQDANDTLTSISSLGTQADITLYTTAVDTWAETPLTAAVRALIDDATAGDHRTTLGLGTNATQNSNSVSISGGSITGIVDLATSDGGTGSGSFVEYSPICGGTSTTGPLQSVVSLGTSGQVLTSNGPGALPTFQPSSGGGGGSDGAKFWLEAAGDGTAILGSFNVSGIADVGPGQLLVGFITPFSSGNWSVSVSIASGSTYSTFPSTLGTNAANVTVRNRATVSTNVDPGTWYLAGFGDQ